MLGGQVDCKRKDKSRARKDKRKPSKRKLGITEPEFVEQVMSAGGTLALAGGWPRDIVAGREPKDKDYMVAGLGEQEFEEAFPKAKRLGKSFPVYMLYVDGEPCHVAMASKPDESGCWQSGADISFEEALACRETTMNSLGLVLPGKEWLDPCGGVADIKQGIVRASSVFFSRNPIHALRAARQAAEFGYTIEPVTLNYMQECGTGIVELARERQLAELKKAMVLEHPEKYFEWLRKAGILEATFPELASLIGSAGGTENLADRDAYGLSLLYLSRMAMETENAIWRFAALALNLGIGPACEEGQTETERGLDQLALWQERMMLPAKWVRAGTTAVKGHAYALHLHEAGEILDFLEAVKFSVLGFNGFRALLRTMGATVPLYLMRGEDLLGTVFSIHRKKHPRRLSAEEIDVWFRQAREEVVSKRLAEWEQGCAN